MGSGRGVLKWYIRRWFGDIMFVVSFIYFGGGVIKVSVCLYFF